MLEFAIPARGLKSQGDRKGQGRGKPHYISKKTMCASNEADAGVSSCAALRMTKRDGLFFEM